MIALTGKENQINQQRHAYQEVDHVNPFSAVTKYSAYVATPEQLPFYLRQAFRAATTGTRDLHISTLRASRGRRLLIGRANLR